MKKRKWYIWIDVLEIKVFVDIIITLIMSNISAQTKDYYALTTFMPLSILAGVVLFIIAFFGTSKGIKKVFRDEHFEMKYRFWSLGLKGLAVGALWILKGVFFDIVHVGIQAITESEQLGHAFPAYTIVYTMLSVIVFLIAVIIGIIVQVVYNKKAQQ